MQNLHCSRLLSVEDCWLLMGNEWVTMLVDQGCLSMKMDECPRMLSYQWSRVMKKDDYSRFLNEQGGECIDKNRQKIQLFVKVVESLKVRICKCLMFSDEKF